MNPLFCLMLCVSAAPDGSVSFRNFRGTYRVRGIGADGQPCEMTAQMPLRH